MGIREASANLLAYLKRREVLRLTAYLDQGGVPTIGWGHARGVRLGQTISMIQAVKFLTEDLDTVETWLSQELPKLSQQEFDALCSMLFNIGISSAWLHSTTLELLRQGRKAEAAARFVRWDKYLNKTTGQLEESVGLRERRIEETAIFLRGEYEV